MGHYRSEMVGISEPTEHDLKLAQEARSMDERGYSEAVTDRYMGVVLSPPFERGKGLRHHRPCGQAVFDPDTHDKFCPARAE